MGFWGSCISAISVQVSSGNSRGPVVVLAGLVLVLRFLDVPNVSVKELLVIFEVSGACLEVILVHLDNHTPTIPSRWLLDPLFSFFD